MEEDVEKQKEDLINAKTAYADAALNLEAAQINFNKAKQNLLTLLTKNRRNGSLPVNEN